MVCQYVYFVEAPVRRQTSRDVAEDSQQNRFGLSRNVLNKIKMIEPT